MAVDGTREAPDPTGGGKQNHVDPKITAESETEDWVSSSLSGTCSCLEVLPIDGGFIIRNGSRARGLRANPTKNTNLEVSDDDWYGFVEHIRDRGQIAPSFDGPISLRTSEGLGAKVLTQHGALVFTWSEWIAFYEGVIRREFDRVSLVV